MSTTFVVRLRVALPDETAAQLGGPTVITVNRLVDADRASQVRDHLLADGTVTIERASTQECVDLGKAVATECQLIIGYRGMIDLARRSGQIVSLSARTVHEKDHFTYRYGLDETVEHVPANGERGQLTYVYAVAKLKDGGVQFEVMSRNEIDKVRAQSKAKDSGPWVTHFEEMAKKTAIRRLLGRAFDERDAELAG
jgi:phage RecT family recombinase